jgi:hypothetical protein
MDVLGGASSMGVLRHDNQYIDIAARSHFSPGRRAKQDDAQGMHRRNDTPD